MGLWRSLGLGGVRRWGLRNGIGALLSQELLASLPGSLLLEARGEVGCLPPGPGLSPGPPHPMPPPCSWAASLRGNSAIVRATQSAGSAPAAAAETQPMDVNLGLDLGLEPNYLSYFVTKIVSALATGHLSCGSCILSTRPHHHGICLS